MEKTSGKHQRKFFCGLLKNCCFLLGVFLFFSQSLFAKEPSPAQIRALVVEPDSKTFFTAQENGYTLKIPEVEPSRVQTDLPQLPSGVQLVSSKREEYAETDGTRGTKVHLWFTFRDTGSVRMPPLITIVGYRTYYLSFGEVEVFENPAVISPAMEIHFEKGVSELRPENSIRRFAAVEGDEIVFSVHLKYFVQIVKFSFEIPKNSIFKEVERYEITRELSSAKEFSSQSVPVATFLWRPLAEGVYSIPPITLVATSYNGSRRTIPVPEIQIKISRNNSLLKDENLNPFEKFHDYQAVFKDAFSANFAPKNDEAKIQITAEQCKTLAQLRSHERNAMPFSRVISERKNFEESLLLSSASGEKHRPMAILFLVWTFVLFAMFAVSLIFKHNKLAAVFFSFALLILIFSVREFSQLSVHYGIFTGGTVSPVPEAEFSASHIAEAGLRVKIIEEAGDYYYIESLAADGWVLKDSVFEIK